MAGLSMGDLGDHWSTHDHCIFVSYLFCISPCIEAYLKVCMMQQPSHVYGTHGWLRMVNMVNYIERWLTQDAVGSDRLSAGLC